MKLSPRSAMHTTEDIMARSQALEVQEKKELVSKEEKRFRPVTTSPLPISTKLKMR